MVETIKARWNRTDAHSKIPDVLILGGEKGFPSNIYICASRLEGVFINKKVF